MRYGGKVGLCITSHLSLREWSNFLINPFTPGDFAKKRVFKLVKWFSGHCHAIKS